MIRFLGMPKVQYFDSNGDPLNGGKVYVYAAGSSTPLDSYPTIADALASTNANTNPVTLDARGEASIVLKGASKLVLKDSALNTLWTQDNITDDVDVYDSSGNLVLDITAVANSVNYFQMFGNSTGNNPTLKVLGSDTNIGMTLKTKGTGTLILDSAGLVLLQSQPIRDQNSNVLLAFTAVSNAVNYLLLNNNATGGGVGLIPAGSDTNIALSLNTKGAGNLNLTSGTSSPVFLIGGASSTSACAWLISGTSKLLTHNINALSTARIITWPDAALDFTGYTTPLAAASQAQMEAASATTVAVTPGVVKNHPGVAKAVGRILGTGSESVQSGAYRIASVVKNSTGNYTVTLSDTFSATTSMYPMITCFNSSGTTSYTGKVAGLTTTTVVVVITKDDGTVADADFFISVFGDL